MQLGAVWPHEQGEMQLGAAPPSLVGAGAGLLSFTDIRSANSAAETMPTDRKRLVTSPHRIRFMELIGRLYPLARIRTGRQSATPQVVHARVFPLRVTQI